MRSSYCIIVIFTFAFGVSCQKRLPSYIKKCKHDDPQLSECVKSAIRDSSKYLAEGIKQLRIPSFNPIVLKEAVLKTDYITGTFKDVKFYNAHKFDITYLKVDFDNAKILINVTFPYLELDCNYTAEGKVINFVLHSEGKMIANFTNSNLTMVAYGEKYKKNDHEYIKWINTDTIIREDSMVYFHLSDLFTGNPEISERFHEIVRENQGEFTKDVIPSLGDIFGQVMLILLNGPFSKYSLNELFD